MRTRIQNIKQAKQVLLIAHYYQESEIQDLADYVGDSLGMAQFASQQPNKIAIVAGVKFMAETIKVLNPDKKILLPDLNAGCSLADSCTPEVFDYFKSKYPGAYVMTYVNSSLAIKAMSDIICTSSNAVKLVQKIPADKKILFAPDQHLGRYVMRKADREMILFPGNCFVHTSFSAKAMIELKTHYPDAAIIAHPECEQVVLDHADFIGSTSQLLKFTQESAHRRYIVMTEEGILYQMRRASPDKEFINGPDMEGCSCNQCPHMKLNTLKKLLSCLETESPEITIEPDLAAKALIPLERMMALSS